MGAFLRLSLPTATGLLAVATIAGIAALYELHLRVYSLLAMVPVIVVAAIYLRAYAERPLAVPPPRRPPAPASAPPAGAPAPGAPAPVEPAASPAIEEPIDDSEPFDDPVEEADRLGPAPPDPGAPAG